MNNIILIIKKELARLVFFEPIKLSTFSSKRTPIGGNKRGENGDVHVPVAVQLALFKVLYIKKHCYLFLFF